jgi:hypothetical protein
MKRLLTMTLACAMLVVLVLSLASCSAYGKIEKNFTAEGYKVVDTKDEEGNDALSFISDFAEDGELSCTVHILKKSVGTYAIVLEFGADADAQKKLSEMLTDEDLANIADVDDSSKLLRGNCILVPFTLNIFDAEDIVNEMVTIFNK